MTCSVHQSPSSSLVREIFRSIPSELQGWEMSFLLGGGVRLSTAAPRAGWTAVKVPCGAGGARGPVTLRVPLVPCLLLGQLRRRGRAGPGVSDTGSQQSAFFFTQFLHILRASPMGTLLLTTFRSGGGAGRRLSPCPCPCAVSTAVRAGSLPQSRGRSNPSAGCLQNRLDSFGGSSGGFNTP